MNSVFSDVFNNIYEVSVGGDNEVDYLVVDVPKAIYFSRYLKANNVVSGQGINIFSSAFAPDWTATDLIENPMLVANYDNNSIDTATSEVPEGFEVTGYIVFRKEYKVSAQGTLTEVDQIKLGEFSGDSTGLKDYAIKNNHFYQWIIYPKLKNSTTSASYLGGMVATDIENSALLNSRSEFDFWTVVFLSQNENGYSKDESNSAIFTFKCNAQGGSITQNMDKTQFDNYTRFPKVSVGEKNYVTGSLTCLLSNVSYRENETEIQRNMRNTLKLGYTYYDENVYKWELWCDYIASGKPCLIKDPKGHMFIANIMSNNGSPYANIQDTPTTISFSFVEIDNSSDYAICSAYK